MKLEEIKKVAYNNWAFPSEETMRSDFAEYKKKEKYKWEGRAQQIGMRFPIFKDYQDFVSCLRNAHVVTLSESFDNNISNRSHTSSLLGLKGLVSSYVRPRDVDRIVKGMKENAKIPYPIVLKGDNGYWIMAGNTRLDVAGILGATKKALVVDVSKTKQYEALEESGNNDLPELRSEGSEDIANFIKGNCQPWLSETSNGDFRVYRGFRYAPRDALAFVKETRADRRPMSTPMLVHNRFDELLKKCGKEANRSNSVFVSGNADVALFYGEVYVTIPIGNFNYTWHTKAEDWTFSMEDVLNQAKWFRISPCKFIKGDDNTLIDAIESGHEIMIKCSSVLAIESDYYNQNIVPIL